MSVKQGVHLKVGLQLARSKISDCFSLEHFLLTFCLQLEYLIAILLFFFKQNEQCFEALEDVPHKKINQY